MEFRLPNLGEGIDTATVTAVLVKPGDAVKAGQAVLSVETDKAAMEVEADAAGTVEQVHVQPGQKVPIGAVVLTIAGSGRSAPSPSAPPASPASGGRESPEKSASTPARAETPGDL